MSKSHAVLHPGEEAILESFYTKAAAEGMSADEMTELFMLGCRITKTSADINYPSVESYAGPQAYFDQVIRPALNGPQHELETLLHNGLTAWGPSLGKLIPEVNRTAFGATYAPYFKAVPFDATARATPDSQIPKLDGMGKPLDPAIWNTPEAQARMAQIGNNPPPPPSPASAPAPLSTPDPVPAGVPVSDSLFSESAPSALGAPPSVVSSAPGGAFSVGTGGNTYARNFTASTPHTNGMEEPTQFGRDPGTGIPRNEEQYIQHIRSMNPSGTPAPGTPGYQQWANNVLQGATEHYVTANRQYLQNGGIQSGHQSAPITDATPAGITPPPAVLAQTSPTPNAAVPSALGAPPFSASNYSFAPAPTLGRPEPTNMVQPAAPAAKPVTPAAPVTPAPSKLPSPSALGTMPVQPTQMELPKSGPTGQGSDKAPGTVAKPVTGNPIDLGSASTKQPPALSTPQTTFDPTK